MRVIRQCRQWKSCSLCLRGEAGILNHTMELNRRFFELREKERESMGLKKPDLPPAGQPVPNRARSGDDWVLYPTLMEFLTEDSWEDGTPRVTATLTFFPEPGQIKASLNDRHFDRVAFVTAGSFEALLGLLEAKLQESSLDWRVRQGKPQGGKRK